MVNNDKEFEALYNLIDRLEKKIDKEAVINERLMHETITHKTDSIKSKMMMAVYSGAFVIVVAPWCFHYAMGLSWWFVGVTIVFMLYCICMELHFKKKVNESIMGATMLQVAEYMADFKQGYRRYTQTNLFLWLPLWIGWLCVEFYIVNAAANKFFLIVYGVSMTAGGILGAIIGLRAYFKMQHTASDIIEQINGL